MFTDRLNDILYHLLPARPGQLINVGAFQDLDSGTRSEIQRAAEKALSESIPAIKASDWLHSPDSAQKLRDEKRRHLFSLMMGAVAINPARYIARIVDLIWDLSNEYTWRSAGGIHEAAQHATDVYALETSSLISWSVQTLGTEIDRTSTDVYHFAKEALSRRVLTPFAARETPAWALKKDGHRLKRLTALLSCILLADEDDHRRWIGVRRCLMLMEDALRDMNKDGVHPYGLEAWQTDAQALSDAATLMLMATGGEVDARGDKKFKRISEYPVNAHMANGRFVNPDGENPPALSGEILFRIGECADNRALKRLGAAMGKGAQAPESATGAVFDILMRRAFMAEAAVYPVRSRVFLPYSMLCACEASSFRASFTGGSFTRGHADAGSLHLYYAGKPVFTDVCSGAFQASMHGLPSVNGFDILKGFGGAKDIEAKFEDAFTYLSINIAPGFDEAAGVLSWQRTIMLSPVERRVRIIEAFDLKSPAEHIIFRFITPVKPESDGEGRYNIGSVRLSWEEALPSRVEPIRGGYRIEIDAMNAGMRGNYAFIVSARS